MSLGRNDILINVFN